MAEEITPKTPEQLELERREYEAARDLKIQELEIAKEKNRHDLEVARDTSRRSHDNELESKRSRLESIRLAKEVLIETNKSKPLDERDISADSITNFANTIMTFIETK